jgi:hypothetical protein
MRNGERSNATLEFPSRLELWVGKYSSDRIRGSNLFELPQVSALLKKYVDAEARAELKSLAVQSPIERRGDWIIAIGCMPHECPSDRYVLAIDGAAREMVLCIKEDDDDSRTTTLRWFGRKPATSKFPIDAGADCASDGADPTTSLLASIAVDQDGHPLGQNAPSPQRLATATPRPGEKAILTDRPAVLVPPRSHHADGAAAEAFIRKLYAGYAAGAGNSNPNPFANSKAIFDPALVSLIDRALAAEESRGASGSSRAIPSAIVRTSAICSSPNLRLSRWTLRTRPSR